MVSPILYIFPSPFLPPSLWSSLTPIPPLPRSTRSSGGRRACGYHARDPGEGQAQVCGRLERLSGTGRGKGGMQQGKSKWREPVFKTRKETDVCSSSGGVCSHPMTKVVIAAGRRSHAYLERGLSWGMQGRRRKSLWNNTCSVQENLPPHSFTPSLPSYLSSSLSSIRYQGCVDRITARGDGTCEPQYMEWLKCIDKHVRTRPPSPFPSLAPFFLYSFPTFLWTIQFIFRSLTFSSPPPPPSFLKLQSAKAVLKALK